MELAKEVEHAGKTVKVYYDPDPTNPRTDWDNATVMVYWTSRYVIGDKRVERCTKEEIMEEYAEKGDPILAILPLNAYIHSGITISTGSYSCMFDSGQVGWVFVTQSKADLMGFPKEYTEEMYEEVIKKDVKTYDDYLTGQVFGYEVIGKEGDHLDSCWGFVGDMDYCLSEGKSAAEHATDPAIFGDNSEEHW